MHEPIELVDELINLGNPEGGEDDSEQLWGKLQHPHVGGGEHGQKPPVQNQSKFFRSF